MIWLVALLGLGMTLFFAIHFPGFRYTLLGLIVLGGIAIFLIIEQGERETALAYSRISPEQLHFSQVDYIPAEFGDGLKITGEVQNASPYTASDIELRAELFDCPAGTKVPPQGCTSIGLDPHVFLSATIPPGGTRSFDQQAYMSNMPQITGTPFLSWRVAKVRGDEPDKS